jgi:uncharacterized protein
MIVPDLNLLIYAYNTNMAQHASARSWWEQTLSNDELVGLCDNVIFGFIRLLTQPRVFANPLSAQAAVKPVQAWLARPNVVALNPCARSRETALALIVKLGTAGSLTTDLQIASLALREDASVYSNDTDFLRIPNLRVVNPLLQA